MEEGPVYRTTRPTPSKKMVSVPAVRIQQLAQAMEEAGLGPLAVTPEGIVTAAIVRFRSMALARERHKQ